VRPDRPALSWAEDPDLLPVSASGINQSDIVIDRLRQRLLTSTLKNTQSLVAALTPFRGRAAIFPFPVLHFLGNGITGGKGTHDVALGGSVNIGVIFLEDTTIDGRARERPKYTPCWSPDRPGTNDCSWIRGLRPRWSWCCRGSIPPCSIRRPCRKAVIEKMGREAPCQNKPCRRFNFAFGFLSTSGRPLGPFEDREDTRCVPLPVA
jgi:hypothetical protein